MSDLNRCKGAVNFLFVSLAVLGLAVAGCGERTFDVKVDLKTSDCTGVDAMANVSFVRLVVTGDGLETPMVSRASKGSGKIVMPEIPVGDSSASQRRRIEVEGLQTLEVGAPVLARGGAVVAMPADGSRADVNVFMRPVDTFGATSSAGDTQVCTTMALERFGHTSTVLRDGRVLIVGGATRNNEGRRVIHASAEIFNPSTGQFTVLSPNDGPKLPRMNHTATLLDSGRVLVAGGEFDNPETHDTIVNKTVEIFDPRSNTFMDQPIEAPRARTLHTATKLVGDVVLLVGGYGDLRVETPRPLATADVFFGSNDTFAEAGPTLVARAEHCAVARSDGEQLLLIGGVTLDESEGLEVADSFQYIRFWPDENRFSNPPPGEGQGLVGRYGHACGVIKDATGGEHAVVVGGYRELGAESPTGGAQIIEIAANATQAGSVINELSSGPVADLCGAGIDDDFVVAGGQGGSISNRADRIVLSTDEGAVMRGVRGSLQNERVNASCASLLDGSMLVTGGESSDGPLKGAEIYTPPPRR